MKEFWLCFVPLLVAVDAIGVLPFFIGLTAGVDPARRRRIVIQSVGTATGVALVFLLAGRRLFDFLGITVPDFMIAGGLLLFVISIADLVSSDKPATPIDPENLGAVPLGVPLIAGPAVLTTILLLVDTHGRPMAALATIVNMALVGLVFWFAPLVYRVMGKTGAKTASKLSNMLLAAIAVMMVRKGVVLLVR